MTLLQLNNTFDAIAAATFGVNSYWFGWPSDRVRMRPPSEAGEQYGAIYPRCLFAVPTMEQDVTQNNDRYNCQLFFDDLLGYDNEGAADDRMQVEKWNNLLAVATAFMKTLHQALPSLRPDGLQIVTPPRYTLDSFTGQARLITVIVDFQIATKATCGTIGAWPENLPDLIVWPPTDTVGGYWQKWEQVYESQQTAVLEWTANTLPLTSAAEVAVFAGAEIPSSSYTVNDFNITLNNGFQSPYTYVIRAIWTI